MPSVVNEISKQILLCATLPHNFWSDESIDVSKATFGPIFVEFIVFNISQFNFIFTIVSYKCTFYDFFQGSSFFLIDFKHVF